MDGWTRNTTSTLIVEIKPSRVATQRLADERPLVRFALGQAGGGRDRADRRKNGTVWNSSRIPFRNPNSQATVIRFTRNITSPVPLHVCRRYSWIVAGWIAEKEEDISKTMGEQNNKRLYHTGFFFLPNSLLDRRRRLNNFPSSPLNTRGPFNSSEQNRTSNLLLLL